MSNFKFQISNQVLVRIGTYLILVLIGIIGDYSLVYAQVVYPIPELGNCTNVATCKVYCDQPDNREACSAFAKAKGILKGGRKVNEKQVSILARAQTELGCQTVPACQALCEQPQNITKCQAFANRHGLNSPPPPSEINDEELLKAAKEKLGCESYDSCARLCEEEKNYTKCAALMQSQVTSEERAMFDKYRGQIKEFLGCDSMVTCMAFCMNPLNTQKCTEFGQKMGFEGSDVGPQEPPEVWCPKVSSECRWDGTNCLCQGPKTCAQSNDIPGCTWDGAQCNCPGIAEEPGEVWCPKAGPGCAWDGAQCICPGTSETPIQTGGGTQEPGDVWCPRLGPYCVWDGTSCTCWDDCIKAGGTWTGSRCDFPQEQTTTQPPDQIYATPEPGEVWCPRNPDCVWTGEVCQCTPVQAPAPTPQVQGAATENLWEKIIEFFLNK